MRPARERRLQGSWPAPGTRSPPSASSSRDSVGARATGSVASNGCGGRWRGVTNAPPLGLRQACGRVHAGLSERFVLVTARPDSGQHPSPRLEMGTSGPSGLAGAQGQGGPLRVPECAGWSPWPGRAGSGAPRFLPGAEPWG